MGSATDLKTVFEIINDFASGNIEDALTKALGASSGKAYGHFASQITGNKIVGSTVSTLTEKSTAAIAEFDNHRDE